MLKQETKKSILQVDNLCKKYKRRNNYAVNNVSFRVEQGQFHGFIGANGAGKTTTIKSIVGVYGKYQGKITIFGKSNHSEEFKKRVGYIPELANFPEGITLFDYFKYMAYLFGRDFKQAKNFANKVVKELKMEEIKGSNPNALSSGQKKKVLLACSLINEPDLLILDEPAANLDPKSRIEFFSKLKRLQSVGKAIFISSHILDELNKFVDSVTILDKGKVVYSGELGKIQQSSKNEFSLRLTKFEKDNNKVVGYLVKHKFIYEINSENKEFILFPKTPKQLEMLCMFVISNHIQFDSIKRSKADLSSIYYKFLTTKETAKEDEGYKRGKIV